MNIFVLALLIATPQAANAPPPQPDPPKPPKKSKPKRKHKDTRPTAVPKEEPVTSPQTPALPLKVEPANPVEQKLDGPLLAILRSFKSGGMVQAQSEAMAQKVSDPKHRVKVDITLTEAAAFKDTESKILEAHGEIVTNLDNRVFAWLPLDAIEPLASLANVWSMAAVRETVVQQ